MSLLGQFVESRTLGYGKVIEEASGELVVEFFVSPWKRVTKTIRDQKYSAKPLLRQMRVFVESEEGWRMGRVRMEFDRPGGGFDYDIQFPNQKKEEIPGENLFVRCLAPFDDPTAMLSNGAAETQFWHDRRAAFGMQLLAQRAASRGLYALLSSAIELVPHQIEVARRVLEDPLQRYVLADEVGMGKTIEAGLIIRQTLLTNDQATIWVATPATLVQQWKRELDRKFYIGEFDDRIKIYSYEAMAERDDASPTMLIVDEAHHVVTQTLPRWLELHGMAADRLLLLSATPSLSNSRILLRLLQLIDHGAYAGLTDAEFDRRLSEREQLGIFLRGFRADTSPILLRQRLKQLEVRFAADSEAIQLGVAIGESLERGDPNQLRLNIANLRSHIADVYRIHQRLVRTRRDDAAPWAFRRRGAQVDALGDGDLSHVLQTWVDEQSTSALAELLEQWRVELGTMYPPGSAERFAFRQAFVRLFDALSSGASAFCAAWQLLPKAFNGSEWNALLATAMGATVVAATSGSRGRQIAQAIVKSLGQVRVWQHGRPRVVVFGSNPDDLNQCAEALRREFGTSAVMIANSALRADGDIATAFNLDPNAEILLCGRAEEEGLNLHFADLLVHLDLPLSPERIEQRIGRLDRFGRKEDVVKQRVILPGLPDETGSYWDAWFDVLANGLHIFNGPISDMQFVLGELTDELAETLLEGGASGLRQRIDAVRRRFSQEREHLDNQYALDRVLQDEDEATAFCRNLEDCEADEPELGNDAKRWMDECLKFQFDGGIANSFTVNWEPEYTLLPVHPWAMLFRRGLKGRKTFKRRIAIASEKPTQLLRVGAALYVAAERHLRWEDRGTAFATWRIEPSVGDTTWLAFKLCFRIEGRLPDAINGTEGTSLRARLDGYLPPWMETLYVGSDLQIIRDPATVEILSRPYSGGNMRGGDLNLGSRPELLERVVSAAMFSRLCRTVREESQTWLQQQEGFLRTLGSAVTRGTTDLERRRRRLELRRSALEKEGATEIGLAREIELNELLIEVLDKPQIRLDSIGAIVVSGQSPLQIAAT